MIHIENAVSYTHLDVYKRQVLQCQCKWTKEAGNIADSAGLSCRREFLQGVGTDGSGTDSQLSLIHIFLGIIQAVTGHTLNLRGSVLPYYLMSAGCMGLKNGL